MQILIEEVILVDTDDQAIGTMEKLEAHRQGLLHRAFSVFVFNAKGQMLLQQRAHTKYHSGGLWTNTCCSHPRPGEDTGIAAVRRLREEMGLELKLDYKTSFIYKADFDNGLIEHEYDHIYTANTELNPIINPEEVAEYTWLYPSEIKKKIEETPGNYTAWFIIAMQKFF
jgi:isopentenyl-diphosphate delta-isomerase